ncbi:MAG: twin-arginine translocase subunit TatC [Bacteroidales bacterium]|nr:twin-arginine translocase subunit TatC [Bacteroidales bacterium]
MEEKSEFTPLEEAPVLMSMGEHLEELRRYLIRMILAVLSAFIIVLFNKNLLFSKIILAPLKSDFATNALMCKLSAKFDMPFLCLNAEPLKLINIHLTGQFTAHMMVSFIASIIIVFPFLLWQLWLFIKPALFVEEREKIKCFIAWASMLFFIGILFSYYIIVPLAINFLGTYKVDAEVDNTITLMSYISSVTMITLAMGIVFQLPLLVAILTRIGILTPSYMKSNRKIVIVIILIVSAIITPPDVFSQLLVAFPLYGLYEISISISKANVRNI